MLLQAPVSAGARFAHENPVVPNNKNVVQVGVDKGASAGPAEILRKDPVIAIEPRSGRERASPSSGVDHLLSSPVDNGAMAADIASASPREIGHAKPRVVNVDAITDASMQPHRSGGDTSSLTRGASVLDEDAPDAVVLRKFTSPKTGSISIVVGGVSNPDPMGRQFSRFTASFDVSADDKLIIQGTEGHRSIVLRREYVAGQDAGTAWFGTTVDGSGTGNFRTCRLGKGACGFFADHDERIVYDYGMDVYGKGTMRATPYSAFGRELSKRVPEADAGDAVQDALFGREEYDRHATKVCVSRLLDSKDWFQVGDDINGEAASDNSRYSLAISSDGMILAIGY